MCELRRVNYAIARAVSGHTHTHTYVRAHTHICSFPRVRLENVTAASDPSFCFWLLFEEFCTAGSSSENYQDASTIMKTLVTSVHKLFYSIWRQVTKGAIWIYLNNIIKTTGYLFLSFFFCIFFQVLLCKLWKSVVIQIRCNPDKIQLYWQWTRKDRFLF